MLIRIRIENFLSFKEPIELSMVASAERIHPHHVFRTPSRKDPNLVRAAALYGPNAAGKSNLVKAFTFVHRLVTRGVKSEQRIPVERFRLDANCLQTPAVFEIEFRVKDVNYAYSFGVDPERIHHEALRTTTTTSEKLLFSRTTSDEGVVTVEFGSFSAGLGEKDQQFLEFVARGTRPNQLFLRETIDRNLQHFRPAYNWFRRSLKVIDPDTPYHLLEMRVDGDRNLKEFLCRALTAAGTGISDIRIEARELDSVSGLPDDLVRMVHDDLDDNTAVALNARHMGRFLVAKRGEKPQVLNLTTVHQGGRNATDASFELHEESDGTQRLLDLLPLLYEGTGGGAGRVLIVDEIDRSLHPHLTKMLVNIHLTTDQAGVPSQLILTTHETHLLDLEVLRRDEIWFMEKREDGSTDLYSLSEFQPRYDKEIRRDYLAGRYGAIPFVGNARFLRLKPIQPDGREEALTPEATNGS